MAEIIDYEPAVALFRQECALEREFLFNFTTGRSNSDFLRKHKGFQIPQFIAPRSVIVLWFKLSVDSQIVEDIAALPCVAKVYLSFEPGHLVLELPIVNCLVKDAEKQIEKIMRRYE